MWNCWHKQHPKLLRSCLLVGQSFKQTWHQKTPGLTHLQALFLHCVPTDTPWPSASETKVTGNEQRMFLATRDQGVHLYTHMTIWKGQEFIYTCTWLYEEVRGSSVHVHDYMKRSGVHLYMYMIIWRGQGFIYTCTWLYEKVRSLSILSILLYMYMTIWRGTEVHLYMYMTPAYIMKRSGVYLYMYMTVWRGQEFIYTYMTR